MKREEEEADQKKPRVGVKQLRWHRTERLGWQYVGPQSPHRGEMSDERWLIVYSISALFQNLKNGQCVRFTKSFCESIESESECVSFTLNAWELRGLGLVFLIC